MTGKQCQQIRTRLGLSLTALAARLGCSARYIHQWERLDKAIPWRLAPRLALVFLQARSEALRELESPRKARPGKWGGKSARTDAAGETSE